jgi:predicted site-specific integrase-resolvase
MQRILIYARVSSGKKVILPRQVDFLRGKYPSHRVITDIGSGVNFQRRACALLDASMQASSEVVGCPLERLARIGYGLLEHIFLRSGSVLTVVEDHACDGCPAELHEVMALTHFTAKHHGRRSAASGKRKVKVKAVKVRIHPTEEQKATFRKYAGTHRFMWNAANADATSQRLAPRPPRRWSVIIMARAVTLTGRSRSARTSARSTSHGAQKKARDGYAQTGEDSTDQ